MALLVRPAPEVCKVCAKRPEGSSAFEDNFVRACEMIDMAPADSVHGTDMGRVSEEMGQPEDTSGLMVSCALANSRIPGREP